MKRTITGMYLCAILSVIPLRGDILSVTGNASSKGTLPAIIGAPADLLDQCVTNTGMQGFNEKQQVTTSSDHTVDGGIVIPAGTTFVNSHMIFLNQGQTGTGLSHANVTWTFDSPIIGVMSDSHGDYEAGSTADFGAVGTNYTTVPVAPAVTSCNTNSSTGERAAPYVDRGIEPPADTYTVAGNALTISLSVAQPGGWGRGLTRGGKIQIDSKPGGYPNCFNINGNGVVPVAILGSSSVNVNDINTTSLTFNGLAVRVKGNNQNQCSVQDVNSDGIPDLVCQFQDDTSNWLQGSTVGAVSGQLSNGTAIRGTDSICVVP